MSPSWELKQQKSDPAKLRLIKRISEMEMRYKTHKNWFHACLLYYFMFMIQGQISIELPMATKLVLNSHDYWVTSRQACSVAPVNAADLDVFDRVRLVEEPVVRVHVHEERVRVSERHRDCGSACGGVSSERKRRQRLQRRRCRLPVKIRNKKMMLKKMRLNGLTRLRNRNYYMN